MMTCIAFVENYISCFTYTEPRVDIIPPEEISLIRIMRKIFQNNDKDEELPGVGMTFEEALDNLRFEKDRRKIKIKRLESQLENRSLSEEEKEELLRVKNHHDEWRDLIEDTLENID